VSKDTLFKYSAGVRSSQDPCQEIIRPLFFVFLFVFYQAGKKSLLHRRGYCSYTPQSVAFPPVSPLNHSIRILPYTLLVINTNYRNFSHSNVHADFASFLQLFSAHYNHRVTVNGSVGHRTPLISKSGVQHAGVRRGCGNPLFYHFFPLNFSLSYRPRRLLARLIIKARKGLGHRGTALKL
jgi:hypothetical protein